MKIGFKRLMVLTVCIAMMTAILAGCGAPKTVSNSDKPAPTQMEVKKAKTEITFWFYPRYIVVGKENGVYEKELAADFMSKNPDISVKVESIPWNSGPEKVNIAISSNAMPDAVFDYPGRIIGYGQKGVLVDLNDMLKPADKEDIPASILAHCIDNEKLYMYPTAIVPIAMGVNKKILKDAGALDLLPLDKPDRKWSISDFEKALEAVKKVKGIQPIVIYAGNEQGDASIRMLLQNFGADFIDKDHTKIVINSEAGIKGLQWIKDAYKKGWLAPGAESLTSTDALDLFNQGKSAFCIVYGAGNKATLDKMIAEKKAPADFDFAFVPQPTAEGVDQKIEAQVVGYCIFNNKDQSRIDASKKFVDYLSNTKDIVKTTGAFPVRKSMGEFYDNPELKFLSTLTSKVADAGYTAKNYTKIRTFWFPNLQAVLTEAKTPKDALDDFAAKATAAMNEK